MMRITVPNCMTLSVPDDGRRWYILKLKGVLSSAIYGEPAGSRSDTVFAELEALGYDVYVPRRRFDKFNRQKRVSVERSAPLMPGYVFMVHPRHGGAVNDWTEVTGNGRNKKGIKGVDGPLRGSDGPLVIPARVIEALFRDEFQSIYDDTAVAKKMRGDSERLKLERRFPVGAAVDVTDGPFASFLAEVDQLTHDGKVKALVSIFNRLVPVEFEAGQLEPRDAKSAA